MGGKTWQEVEERLFWQVLVPQSPEALDPSDRKYSWGDISAIMKEELGHLHFRKYTCQLIYEHFYQNFRGERLSPKARNYVNEWRRLKELPPLGCVILSGEPCGKAPSASATHRWSPEKPPRETVSPRADTDSPLSVERPSFRSDNSFHERQHASPVRHVVSSVQSRSPLPVGVIQDKPASYARAPVPHYDLVAEAQYMAPPPRSRLPLETETRGSRCYNEQRAPVPYYDPVAEAPRMLPPLRNKLASEAITRGRQYHIEQRAPVPHYDPIVEAQRAAPLPTSRLLPEPATRESPYHHEQRAPVPVSLPPIESFDFAPRYDHPLTRKHPSTFTFEGRQQDDSGILAPPQTPEPPDPIRPDAQKIQGSETSKNMPSVPNGPQNHGALFEALLLATSVSSGEPSPSGSSNGRSGSLSSATTVAENSNDDNSGPDAETAPENCQSQM